MDDPSTAGVTEGFGLMFYNARMYDPYLNHFTQPDSIVPDPYNPQDWNRYSYVRNNPIRYNDPTGHVCSDPEDETGGCEGGGGTLSSNYAANFYRTFLKDRYGWTVADDFTEEELRVVRQTAYDIESYVDGLTGGMGQEWMLFNLGNTTITHGNNTDSFSQTLPSLGGGNTIYLGQGWLNGNWTPNRLLAHELGHVWDLNTADRVSVEGAIGGVGDDLNLLVGGSVLKSDGIHSWCRWCDMRSNGYNPLIPTSYQYIRGAYANSSTADYLAETFAFVIYPQDNPGGGNDVGQAAFWVNFFITFQGTHLP